MSSGTMINILSLFCWLYFSSFFKTSCYKARVTEQKSGLILLKSSVIDKVTKIEEDFSLRPNVRIWYSDSCLIIEKLKLHIEGRLFQEDTSYTSITGYGFIDIRKQLMRFYKNFSDTAMPIISYKHLDSVRSVSGMDPFFVNKTIAYKNTIQLSDTVIESVAYKRMSTIRESSDDPNYFYKYIYYYNCNAPSVFMSIITMSLLPIPGCIVTRYDTITEDLDYYISIEKKLLRENLTIEEQKVFNAWRRF